MNGLFIYGIPGMPTEYIFSGGSVVADLPADAILMRERRPSPEYVAFKADESDQDPRAAWGIPVKSLQELARVAMARVNAEYTKRIGFITAEYPAEEIASFDKQVIQAERYLAGETTRVGWLLTCAAGRGITAEQLATRILELDALFEVQHAQLTAVRQNHEKAIQELLVAGEKSRTDLENYGYLEGWGVDVPEQVSE